MLNNEKTAEVCWGAMRALMREHYDAQLPEWPALLDWHRQLHTDMVQRTRMGDSPEQIHAQWCEEARARGVVLGDWVLNTSHPWLRPWAELTPDDRLAFKLMHHMVMVMTLEHLTHNALLTTLPDSEDLAEWSRRQGV